MRLLLIMLVLAGGCIFDAADSGGGDYTASVHPAGILDPASPQFHGRELERRGWDFAVCAGCHGDDFGGGKAGVSCKSCHQDGPTGCTTCHGTPPASGSHQAHQAAEVPCAECHQVPARWDAPGHIVGADGAVDPTPAEVVLGALASRDLVPPRRSGPPAFDGASCRNVFCHGGAFADASATLPAPRWGQDSVSCGSCHGLPPADHAPSSTDCARCHPQRPGDHLDGIVELGHDGAGGCSSCHGDATSAAPPRGLGGETLPTTIAVGAHRAHVEGPSGLHAPLGCDACHAMPATVTAAGHLDSALPAEVTLASGTWDRDAASCSNVYCHGAATPVWTRVGRGEAACGTCHGVPPAGAPHDPTMTVFDCERCHPALSEGLHMNGTVDE
jgi:predicted CxxxxCH...CXXCH cytochrome family protein